MNEKVGFVGPGIMGRPMALNLITAGYPLWVYARRAEAAQPLVDQGARICSSPREVGEQADIIITCVSDTPDVEEVILGDDGVIHGAGTGKVIVDMSTISASVTRVIAEQLRANGIEMLDAPVSGGDQGAIAGTLSIMVGGKAEIFERVKSLFEVMGENIVHVGDHGAGQIAKTCNQILVAQHIAAAGEALLLAKAAGVDPAKVRDALLGGFAASRALEVHGQRMLDRNFEPGFKSKLHNKDMRIAMEIAKGLGLELRGAELAADEVSAVNDQGHGEKDTSAIVLIQEARNKVSLEV